MSQKQKTRLALGTMKERKKEKYQCDVCSNSYTSYGRYQHHIKTHKMQYYTTKDKECEYKSEKPDEFDQHQNETEHSDIHFVAKDFKNIDPSQPYFQLPDKNDEIESTKISESKTHTVNEQSQTTEQCTENWTPGILKNTTNVCSTCGKSFSCKQNLQVHERSVHKMIRSFECSYCDKSFSYANSLKVHLMTHAFETRDSPTPYKCTLCEKGFLYQSSLLYHKETAHNNGRKFACVKCGKRFNHKQRLVRHQIVHSDTRPFACNECNSAFKTRANLKNHQAVHRGEKRFVCKICGQKFSYK
ncbi:unnamed protein product [Acanthoscelides obtectus]|uniref:C2H2-type domain-containing protein n=2 Tax=Acanthoscelides obtectus TaxID=200917 RepID=A0A9P0Q1Y7_ACAOB|nr:unnamed protein product [Acanthoscelides obtectus]CAK1667098.1 Zinc finger protein 337 [Acanthoscelides obtectus]